MSRSERKIRPEEVELLRHLAAHDPGHRDELLKHISAIDLIEEWEDGTQTISIMSDRNKGIAVEATASDEDGANIEIMLWTNGEKVCLLEMFRSDGDRMKRYPAPSSLKDIWDREGNPRPAGW